MKKALIVVAVAALAAIVATLYVKHAAQGRQEEAKHFSLPAKSPMAHLAPNPATAEAKGKQAGAQPQQVVTPSEASPDVLLITGKSAGKGSEKTGEKAFNERNQTIRRLLGKRLPTADVKELVAYLADPATARQGDLWDLSLKNDVLEVLLMQERVPAGLSSLMAGTVTNRTLDLTWRDYVLQHYPPYVRRAGVGAEEAKALRDNITQAMTEKSSVLPGTSLIAMWQLAEQNAFYQKNEVVAAARTVLNDPGSCQASRITAIQVLAQLGDTESLGKARAMATDESRPAMERMSAIAALGMLGGSQDVDLLKGLLGRTGLDARIKTAANFSREQLERKLKRM